MQGPADAAVTEAKLQEAMEMMQVRDSLKMYNSLVSRCFAQCISSFRGKQLDATETACVTRCAEKFLKHSARVSLRFAEINQQFLQAQQQMATAATTLPKQ